MKRKLLKKVMLIGCLTCLCVPVLGGSGMTMAAETEVPEQETDVTPGIQPRKDKIGWVYRTVAGSRYRRLFNYTKNQYEGDWILCN